MPNFRRSSVRGGSFFFTVVTHQRVPFLCEPEARRLLRCAFLRCRARWPFTLEAIVLLPDHLHAVWTLPPDDEDYSKRWGWIKKEFTKTWLEHAQDAPAFAVERWNRRRSVWQAKFWEHTLRDAVDFQRHLDYLHFNPVKHGYVECPYKWRWSSFHRWVKQGVYEKRWACPQTGPAKIDFADIQDSVGE